MKDNKSVVIWLLSGCFLIFIMVLIGGITRLTDSGLSMSTWSLIGGAPPLNFQEWVDSRSPAELCEGYKTGLIPADMLPGGEASDPCSTFNGDNPLDYVIQ